jgi:fibrillarin-like pre-rRNA processing protein
MRIKQLFPNIYKLETESETILTTLNWKLDHSIYGERLIDFKGRQYRSWNPYRSKLSAAIMRGLKNLGISPGDRVLYLGVASGTTCSHISDIVGSEGHIWGVEFSYRPIRDLIEKLVKFRENISPILADARYPETYSSLVPRVEAIYADVAQPNQASILIKNSRFFLKKEGWAIMAIKSRSVDVSKTPRNIYQRQLEILEEGGFKIMEFLELEPYIRDHALVVSHF